MKRFRIPRRQKMFAVLPTMLTLGNAVCGFGAITFAAKVGLAERLGWGRTNTECLWIAAVLIFLAMVFDMLDEARHGGGPNRPASLGPSSRQSV